MIAGRGHKLKHDKQGGLDDCPQTIAVIIPTVWIQLEAAFHRPDGQQPLRVQGGLHRGCERCYCLFDDLYNIRVLTCRRLQNLCKLLI